MSKRDPLEEVHKGLGRKPSSTKRIRTGWCSFCRIPVELKRTKGIGYLCPKCGGHVWGNKPGITRQIFHG